MAQQTSTILKTYFETGDKPSQGQFEDFIDSKQQTLVTESSCVALTSKPNGTVSIETVNSKNQQPFKIWIGTEAEYNSIQTKDSNTIYNITE